MGLADRVRDRQPAGATRRQSTKSLGSAKPPVAKTIRSTLHLSEQVVERLGVHCSLAHRDRSAVANEILAAWLTRFGKGRAIFEADDQPGDPADVDLEDRPDEASDVTSSDVVRGL
jgi:hypothetical protein